MLSITALPNETLQTIFRFCCKPSVPNPPEYSTLNSAIRVCKRWHSLALPILYSRIALHNTRDISQSILFVEAVFQRNPAYAEYVHSLDLSQVILPIILEQRLAQCAFVNLKQLHVYPKICLQMHDSTIPLENTLEKLYCWGKACQKMLDRHSKSLKALMLCINTRATIRYCGSLPTLPLPQLRSLDLIYERGCLDIMANFANMLPAVTKLIVRIEPKELREDDRIPFRTGLEVFLYKIGRQLGSLALHTMETWPLDGCQVSYFPNLKRFIFSGHSLPKWGINGLRDLSKTLKRMGISCDEMEVSDITYIMDMFSVAGNFPNLTAIPQIANLEITPTPAEFQELKDKAFAALCNFNARNLRWEGPGTIWNNSAWSFALVGHDEESSQSEGSESGEEDEEEDSDNSDEEIQMSEDGEAVADGANNSLCAVETGAGEAGGELQLQPDAAL